MCGHAYQEQHLVSLVFVTQFAEQAEADFKLLAGQQYREELFQDALLRLQMGGVLGVNHFRPCPKS